MDDEELQNEQLEATQGSTQKYRENYSFNPQGSHNIPDALRNKNYNFLNDLRKNKTQGEEQGGNKESSLKKKDGLENKDDKNGLKDKNKKDDKENKNTKSS